MTHIDGWITDLCKLPNIYYNTYHSFCIVMNYNSVL